MYCLISCLCQRIQVSGVVRVALGPVGRFAVERGRIHSIWRKTILPTPGKIRVGDGGPANDDGVGVPVSDEGDQVVPKH